MMKTSYKKIKFTIIGITLIVSLLAIWKVLFNSSDIPPHKSNIKLEEHPLYKNYKFGETANIIDIGIQPLWLPPGIITEVMSRDLILRRNLEQLGVEIRFHEFLKGSDVNFFLARGDLEAGVGGDMPALCAAAHHKAKIASMIQQGFCSIVAHKYMLISDLRNKRVGIPYGSNAHYALISALNGVNLTISDIKPVFMDVASLPDALNNKQIDAYTAWEPTPSVSLDKFADQVVIHRSLSTGYFYFRDSFFRDKPEVVILLLDAQIRAMYWMKYNKDHLRQACKWTLKSVNNLSESKLQLSEDIFMHLAEKDLLGRNINGYIPESDLSDNGCLIREFKFLMNLGEISSTIGWDELKKQFDNSLIDEIMKNEIRFDFSYSEYERGNQ
jgi:sulfonate transport system substrate-binding protein